MESAVAFYDKLESDESLGAHIQKLGDKEKIAVYVKDELGYDFTPEEMQKVVFERNPEMTDEEIEAVVGGGYDMADLMGIAYGGAAIIVVGSLALAAAA